MNLIEYAKGVNFGTDNAQARAEAIVDIFSNESKVVPMLQLQNINGMDYRYMTRDKFPDIAFRGFNEQFTASTSIINPQIEQTKLFGAKAEVDKALVDAFGMGRLAMESEAQLKASANFFDKTFFKGDSLTNPAEFDGLQARITGANLFENHATGAPLSLFNLDRAIARVKGANAIFMGSALMPYFIKASRTSTVAGNVNFQINEMGKQVMYYGTLPITWIEEDNNGTDILGFSEANSTTSIYVANLGADAIRLIQTVNIGSGNAIDVINTTPTEIDGKYKTGLDWKASMIIENPRHATRVSNITAGDITA